MERVERQWAFIMEADRLKRVIRQSLLMDGSRRENAAEHSWHFALMAHVLIEYAKPKNVDLGKVVEMALIHDLAEIEAGDLFAYDEDSKSEHQVRERKAAEALFNTLPEDQAKHYRNLWDEYEKMESNEAIYAAAVDRLQPFINNFHTDGYTWVKYGVTKAQVMKRMHPVKVAMPMLWPKIESMIEQSIKKSWIRPS